jgi:hypothetical protein
MSRDRPPAPSGPSPTFDRIARSGAPARRRRRGRDGLGKEALYSTAPTAAPSAQLDARCRRCGARLGLSAREAFGLFRPPFLWDPVRRRLLARCPACERRSWLELHAGQALRALLDRRPAG